MNSLWQDFRFGARMLAKAPGFTAVAVLTLALGIGANTSIFTVANALMLRPLPYSDPGRIALIFGSRADQPGQFQPFSYPRFTLIRDQNRSFSGVAALANENFNFTGRGTPEQLTGARVTWNFFDVLGVQPALGRAFLAEEGRPEGKEVVLISHEMWAHRFGSDKTIVGQSISLDSRSYTVAGVLPAGFSFAYLGAAIDVWVPREFELNLLTKDQVQAGAGYLNAVARLRPGVTLGQANAELRVLEEQYRNDNPGRPDADPKLMVEAGVLQDQIVSNVRPALLILLAAVGAVLLIACANVASLLLSRSLARRREIAVRAALGAGRGKIVRQLLTESLLLAVLSGSAGILLAQLGTTLLARYGRNNLPAPFELSLDLRVLAFTTFISLASAVLFGLMPALQLSSLDLNSVLRDEGRGSVGSRNRHAARSLLVVGQVALSMILLVGSGLLIRSFILLLKISPGFDPHNVLTMQIGLPPARYGTPPQLVAFYDQLLERAQNLPGVEAAEISSAIPLLASRFSPVLVEGQPTVPIGQRPLFAIQTISPAYTKVLRVPLVRGREFTNRDNAESPPVALVNQVAVRMYWPNDEPVGKHLWLGRRTTPVEVIGVLGDMKNVSLSASAMPEIFLPFPQLPWAALNLSLRTRGEPHSLASAARSAVASVDKDQPVTNVQSLDELLDTNRAQARFFMFLLGVFSGTAFLLAVVGIYGLIAYSVAQRTSELGIRMALGASPQSVQKLVIRHGLWLAGGGVVIGLIASLALTRLMNTLLYQVRATDPITFIVSAILFTTVAVLASYLPARRAARISPADALRWE